MEPTSAPGSAAEFEVISSELLRNLRGRRSQTAFSRRLGYSSNIAHRWERGQCWPSASRTLQICQTGGVDVAQCIATFFQRKPEWLNAEQSTSPAAVAAFLSQLKGKTPLGELAKRTGYNRYSISRWLKGEAEPRLPAFLCLVQATSRRLIDLLSLLTAVDLMPSVASDWQRLTSAREVAYALPHSHAVLRALELEDRRARQSADWLSQKLGLTLQQVEDALSALADTGQIERSPGGWAPTGTLAVDTSKDTRRARELKLAWMRTALERLESGAPGNFGYSVFAVSKADLKKLRELHLEYVRAMQSVVSASSPNECVGLYCAQLLDMSTPGDNAFD